MYRYQKIVVSVAAASLLIVGCGDNDEKSSSNNSGEISTIIENDFTNGSMMPWTAYSVTSDADWEVASYGGNSYLSANGYGADTASDDWVISPKLSLSGNEILSFKNAKNYDGPELKVLVSNNYAGNGDPHAATWTELTPVLSTGNYTFVDSGELSLSSFAGDAYVAFQYVSTGTNSGDGAIWQVDDVKIVGSGSVSVAFEAGITPDLDYVTTLTPLTLTPSATGGDGSYSHTWDLGDGTTSHDESVTHTYTAAGSYTVNLTVADGSGMSATSSLPVEVVEGVDESMPAKQGDLRIATFNSYLNRTTEGGLKEQLEAGENQQIKNVAEIIQRVNPDVLLLQEFDYAGDEAVELFINNFLKVSQSGQNPVEYAYYFTKEVNTGTPTDIDLNGDGSLGTADDAYGYGEFPGQYGMVVLSKYPIQNDSIRTFQKFLWKDMPNGNLPTDYYSSEAQNIFRLSSKDHWDLPIEVNGKTFHVLASHPTPPVFDDGDADLDSTLVDWNGKRNHDEIRLWADYVSGNASYLYDDGGVTGGLASGERFVIMGDQNADPDEGDSYQDAVLQLLESSAVNTSFTPTSEGPLSEGLDADDTANWAMRADYVLPSVTGLSVNQSGIFWPKKNDIKYTLMEKDAQGGENSSDHRLVWIDVSITD